MANANANGAVGDDDPPPVIPAPQKAMIPGEEPPIKADAPV